MRKIDYESPTHQIAIQLALLHDTIEDTDTRESELEEKFGIIIPVYVKALTKNKDLPKGEQMIDSLNPHCR